MAAKYQCLPPLPPKCPLSSTDIKKHRPPPPLPLVTNNKEEYTSDTQSPLQSSLTFYNPAPYNTSRSYSFLRGPDSFRLYESIATPETSRKKLNDIVQSCILPVRVCACESLYGVGECFTFMTEDTIDLHFLKESTVASVILNTGDKMKIPLNSDFHLSLVYDSPGIVIDSHQTASQLLKKKPLPKLVTVGKECKKSEFFEGEVLMLQNIVDTKAIECFSLLTGKCKRVHKSSKVIFIANPSDVILRLSDLEHLSLPLKVLLHPSKANLERIFSEPCTIESLNKELSVIASFSNDKQAVEEFLAEKHPVYEISVCVPLEFQLAIIQEKDSHLLFQKSKALFDVFTPAYVKKVINALPAVGKPRFQENVYQMPQSGEGWKKGIKIFPPADLKFDHKFPEKGQHQEEAEDELSNEKTEYTHLNPDTVHSYMYTKKNTAHIDTLDYEKMDDPSVSRSAQTTSSNPSASMQHKGKNDDIISVMYH